MRNTTFNNKTFTWASIRAMRTIHETMSRVYQAAKELRGIEGPAEVARLLNESPQLINNWERRGVSSSGLLKIALTLGCRAAWLSTGEGSMIETATDHSAGVHPSGLARQLINRIAEADARGYLTKEVADLINGIMDLKIASASSGVKTTEAASDAAKRSHAAATEAAQILRDKRQPKDESLFSRRRKSKAQ